jgi:hypothetical protein
MVLSVEKRVVLVEYVFREGNRYTDLVQEQFAETFPRNTLYLIAMQFIELLRKNRVTGSVLGAERSGRPSKLNDKKLMDSSDTVLRSASES